MSSRTTYQTAGAKDAVWAKAKPINGKDANTTRQDPYGDPISYSSYGKDTAMGWNIDHIKPQSKGGSHDIKNLQALQSSTNKSKGDSLVKKSRHNQK